MDGLLVLLLFVAGLALLGAAAVESGVDTRPGFEDARGGDIAI